MYLASTSTVVKVDKKGSDYTYTPEAAVNDIQ